jgi:hypothetical protein
MKELGMIKLSYCVRLVRGFSFITEDLNKSEI